MAISNSIELPIPLIQSWYRKVQELGLTLEYKKTIGLNILLV